MPGQPQISILPMPRLVFFCAEIITALEIMFLLVKVYWFPLRVTVMPLAEKLISARVLLVSVRVML